MSCYNALQSNAGKDEIMSHWVIHDSKDRKYNIWIWKRWTSSTLRKPQGVDYSVSVYKWGGMGLQYYSLPA